MNGNATQQEVLVITGTSFATRLYSENDPSANSKNIPGNEQLKDACWNGLIKEMVPEIFSENETNAAMYLWQVREANHFLALEMSEYPTGVDKLCSIDPYRFIELQEFN